MAEEPRKPLTPHEAAELLDEARQDLEDTNHPVVKRLLAGEDPVAVLKDFYKLDDNLAQQFNAALKTEEALQRLSPTETLGAEPIGAVSENVPLRLDPPSATPLPLVKKKKQPDDLKEGDSIELLDSSELVEEEPNNSTDEWKPGMMVGDPLDGDDVGEEDDELTGALSANVPADELKRTAAAMRAEERRRVAADAEPTLTDVHGAQPSVNPNDAPTSPGMALPAVAPLLTEGATRVANPATSPVDPGEFATGASNRQAGAAELDALLKDKRDQALADEQAAHAKSDKEVTDAAAQKKKAEELEKALASAFNRDKGYSHTSRNGTLYHPHGFMGKPVQVMTVQDGIRLPKYEFIGHRGSDGHFHRSHARTVAAAARERGWAQMFLIGKNKSKTDNIWLEAMMDNLHEFMKAAPGENKPGRPARMLRVLTHGSGQEYVPNAAMMEKFTTFMAEQLGESSLYFWEVYNGRASVPPALHKAAPQQAAEPAAPEPKAAAPAPAPEPAAPPAPPASGAPSEEPTTIMSPASIQAAMRAAPATPAPAPVAEVTRVAPRPTPALNKAAGKGVVMVPGKWPALKPPPRPDARP
jgi:hypothetical protein